MAAADTTQPVPGRITRHCKTPTGKKRSALNTLAVAIARGFIRAYQLGISPLLGPRCRYYPTCSQYTLQALEDHGLLRGLVLSIKRLTRCHPGCEGGIDEVPTPNHTHTN